MLPFCQSISKLLRHSRAGEWWNSYLSLCNWGMMGKHAVKWDLREKNILSGGRGSILIKVFFFFFIPTHKANGLRATEGETSLSRQVSSKQLVCWQACHKRFLFLYQPMQEGSYQMENTVTIWKAIRHGRPSKWSMKIPNTKRSHFGLYLLCCDCVLFL